MNIEDELMCREMLSVSSISGPSQRLQIRNECLLMQPFAQTDFLTLRRIDGSLYNYSANISIETWEQPEKLLDLMKGHNFVLGNNPELIPNHLASYLTTADNEDVALTEFEVSMSHLGDFKGDTTNQNVPLFNPERISNRKLPTSKYKLPFRDDDSNMEKNRPKEKFTYKPSSIKFYSDITDSECVPLGSSSSDRMHSSTLLNNNSSSTTKTTMRKPLSTGLDPTYKYYPHSNHMISYSWDSLQLGKNLGTPAFNRFRENQQLSVNNYLTEGPSIEYDSTMIRNKVQDKNLNYIDIQPLQMLQLVNTLRPATCYPPLTHTSNKNPFHDNGYIHKMPLSSNYRIHHRDLQCDLNESVDDIILDSSFGKELLGQDEVKREDVPTEMISIEEPYKLHVPSSDVENLFRTMQAQDVDDGSLFRHETIYLPPWEVIDYLRQLENDATLLNEWESKIIMKT